MSDANHPDCYPSDKYKKPPRFAPPSLPSDSRRSSGSVMSNSAMFPPVHPSMPPCTRWGEVGAGNPYRFAASGAGSRKHQNQEADTCLLSGDAPDIRPSVNNITAAMANDNNSFERNDYGGDLADGNGCFSPFPLAMASGDEGADGGDRCYDSDVSDVSSVGTITKTCGSYPTPSLQDGDASPRPATLAGGNSKRVRTSEEGKEGGGRGDSESTKKRMRGSCASPGLILPSDCDSDAGAYSVESVDSIEVSSQTTMDIETATASEFEDDGAIGSGDPPGSSKMQPLRSDGHGKALAQNKMPKKAKNGVPKRPLTAYKLFFREESAKLLAENDKDKDKISSATTPPSDAPSEAEKEEKGRGEDAFLKSLGFDISQWLPDPIEEGDVIAARVAGGGGAVKKKKVKKNCGSGDVRRRDQSSLVFETQGGNKISFQDLGCVIGKRWRALPSEKLSKYERMANEESQRYQNEMEGYYGRGGADRPHHQQGGKVGTYQDHEQDSAASAAQQQGNAAHAAGSPWYPNGQHGGPIPSQLRGPLNQRLPQQPSPQFHCPSQRQGTQKRVSARYAQYQTPQRTAMPAYPAPAHPTRSHRARPVPRDDQFPGVSRPGVRRNVVVTSCPSNAFPSGDIPTSRQQPRPLSMETQPSPPAARPQVMIPDPATFSMPPPHCIDISNHKSTEPIILPPPRTVVVRDRQTGVPRRYQLMYAAVCMPTEAAKRYMASVADIATAPAAATAVPSVQKQACMNAALPPKMNQDMAAATASAIPHPPHNKFPVFSKSFEAGQRPSHFDGAEATPCLPPHDRCSTNYFFGPPHP